MPSEKSGKPSADPSTGLAERFEKEGTEEGKPIQFSEMLSEDQEDSSAILKSKSVLPPSAVYSEIIGSSQK